MAARSDVNDFRVPRMYCLLSNNVCMNVYDDCGACYVNLERERLVAKAPRRGGF